MCVLFVSTASLCLTCVNVIPSVPAIFFSFLCIVRSSVLYS